MRKELNHKLLHLVKIAQKLFINKNLTSIFHPIKLAALYVPPGNDVMCAKVIFKLGFL